MIATARLAYGNARVRAMRSRLLGAEDGVTLRAAASLATLSSALGLAPAADARQVRLELFGAIVRDYGKVMASYPSGRALFAALLGLHEIENLKLFWRARSRGLPPERWTQLWRPIEPLAALELEDWRRIDSLSEGAALARGTPYEPIVADVLRAHERDPASAELALDRWAWRRLAAEAARLPRRERAARDLVLALVKRAGSNRPRSIPAPRRRAEGGEAP